MKKTIFLIPLVLIAVLIVIILFNYNFFLNSKVLKSGQFEVKQGQGVGQIASNLKNTGYINSDLYFKIFIYQNRWTLQSGYYTFSDKQSVRQIAEILKSGEVDQIKITVPEGYRVSQIDELIVSKGIGQKGEFLKLANNYEGFLFPDTYNFPKDVTPKQIYETMNQNFLLKTKDLAINDDIIILASIVEREALNDAERPQIAGVYQERLDIGMKLDADPTVQYAKGTWKPLTRADYKNVISPYNTYLNRGLPPTPICSPGLESIKAALNPKKEGYFYFFHTKQGELILSKTYEQHQEKLLNNR